MGGLLSLLSPVAVVCGIREVSGLDIQKISSPLYDPGKSSCEAPYSCLDTILEEYYFPQSVVHHRLSTSFLEAAIGSPESGSEMTNTDLENISVEIENDGTSRKPFCLFALNTSPNENDSRKKYLLREDEVNMAESSLIDDTKNLCKKLARDACRIANAEKSSFKRNSTTCLCVVLRDEYGNAKKFVFHNGQDKMSATMEKKAQDLKYAIRTGYKAHAEAEFIQFLLQRMEQKGERYTHILGMGCSRMHCRECDALLKLFLGKSYHRFTAAAKSEENSPPVVTNTENGCLISTEIDVRVVYENDAVNILGNRSEKYYLPQILQDHVNKRLASSIDFSNDRFVIKDEETMIKRRQRSDKKRKIAMLSST